MFNQIIFNREQHHKNLTARIKKNNKGINTALWGMAILAVSITLSYTIPESTKAKENIKGNEILIRMTEMDDIAHQQDVMIHEINSGYNEKRDKLFHTVDHEYHAAQYRDEKTKAAKKLYDMVKEQNAFLHEIIPENPFSRKAKEQFEKLRKEINQLLQS